MLEYFIDDCDIDINKRDHGTGDPMGIFRYWDMPLRYAVSGYYGVEVFR